MRRTRTRAALIATITGLALVLVSGPASAQAPDPRQATPEEKAAAVVRPAMVFLSTDYSGYVFTQGGLLVNEAFNDAQPYQISSTCSAFVVNPSGYIATAGHCVDNGPEGAREHLLTAAVQQVVAADPTIDGNQLLQFARSNWRTEGQTAGSPIDRTVTVLRGTGTGTSLEGKQVPAQVVDYRPFSEGDVALIKVAATELPAIELAAGSGAQTGTRVLSVGYPGATANVTDPNLEPTFKDGQVSKETSRGAIPVYEISAAVAPGMSGGPTVGLDGKVIGVNSFGATAQTEAFNFVVPAAGLNELLGRNNVRAEPGPYDVLYRAGLQDYYAGRFTDAINKFDQVLAVAPDYVYAEEYKTNAARAKAQFGDAGPPAWLWWVIAGGAVLLLAAGLVTWLLIRRRRRRAAPPSGGPAPGVPGAQLAPTVPAPRAPEAAAPQQTQPLPTPATPPDGTAGPSWAVPPPAAPAGQVDGSPAPTGPETGVETATPPGGTPGTCPQCGASRQPGARFCYNCGHRFGD
jgi:S1-C subfamily serine protease